ncbi:TIR domain-containing protein [Stieleria varia]|uniref:Leucine Rich repeats (2 copies) n=1 Tax=Stieleria varia TaxID=2528005 RepID=A0A5C6AZE4_9BACT|nr:TIR domain-containing protein [Stieleria varia]TWU04376.1 Leucine Rich repeats (2 copies) [Stieleria varia]
MSVDAFISYSTQDDPVAIEIRDALEDNGIRCWYAPRDAPPGYVYQDTIPAAIRQTKFLLLILSEHSIQSRYVHSEVSVAYSMTPVAKPILTYRLDEFEIPDRFKFLIGHRTWIDAHHGAPIDHLRSLVQSARLLCDRSSTEIGTPPTIKKPQIECDLKENRRQAVTTLRLSGPDVTSETLLDLGDVTQGRLCKISDATQLRGLSLYDTQIDDQALELVSTLPSLTLLRIERTPVTDRGMEHLPKLQNLEDLWLSGTEITDRGISSLRSMQRLEQIRANDTRITDDAIPAILEISRLKELHIERTGITEKGIKRLETMLRIVHH